MGDKLKKFQEKLKFALSLVESGANHVEKTTDPKNDYLYYKGYREGYTAGMRSAIETIERHMEYYMQDTVIENQV